MTSTVRPGPRAVVGGLRADVSLDVELDVRTAYDFVLSPRAGDTEELLPEDRRWLAAARASAGRAIGDDAIFGLAPDDGLVSEVAHLIAPRPAVQTAADVVAMVASLSDDEIIAALLDDFATHDGRASLVARVLAGEPGALEEFEAGRLPVQPDDCLAQFIRDPHGSVTALRTGLAAWLEPYQEIEGRVRRMLAHDADARRVDLASLPPAEAIERATGGLRWLPEPQIRKVILAPSYFGRPYNWLFGTQPWRLIVYPIADEALDQVDRLAPPPGALRLYRALGDDTRLRILRLLVDRDLYLTELAQRLELSKPTVKHHLTQLRTAGLVTITAEGGLTYYSLRRNRVEEAGPELSRFLGI